jgi:hypothetical protein
MTDLRGYHLGSGEGKAWWFLDTLMTVKAGGDDTHDSFTLIEFGAPIGFGPPLHVEIGCIADTLTLPEPSQPDIDALARPPCSTERDPWSTTEPWGWSAGRTLTSPRSHWRRTRSPECQKMGERPETKVLDRAAFRIGPPRSAFVVRRSLIDRRPVARRGSASQDW